jgi:hypothetical protein
MHAVSFGKPLATASDCKFAVRFCFSVLACLPHACAVTRLEVGDFRPHLPFFQYIGCLYASSRPRSLPSAFWRLRLGWFVSDKSANLQTYSVYGLAYSPAVTLSQPAFSSMVYQRFINHHISTWQAVFEFLKT